MDEHVTQNEALTADKSTEFSLLPIKKKKSGRVPDFFIAVPAFLALEAFQINTDEDDTGGQLWVHRLTGYYIKNLSGGIFAGVLSLSEEPTRLYRISGWGDYVRTLPECGELGINLAKKHPSLHPLTAHGEGEIYLHRNKLQDIIEIANLAMSKGCGFTVLRFEGMQLVDAEKRKQYREMLAKVYAGTLFLNAGYRNVTPYLNAPLPAPQATSSEGIFFEGQIFDAYVSIANFVKSAKKSIVLVDNYIDESVLTILSKRNSGVDAIIYTSKISSQLKLDLEKHDAQYPPITINTFKKSHDRFLIIDDTVYHFGASLKDFGRKWSAFSKTEFNAAELLRRIETDKPKAAGTAAPIRPPRAVPLCGIPP